MSCGVGRRCGLDPTLLWLWLRLAATALIQPVAWELPYAMGIALKSKKKKKKKQRVGEFLWQNNKLSEQNFFFFFFFLAVLAVCGSSWAKDQIPATAVSQAAAVTMLNP